MVADNRRRENQRIRRRPSPIAILRSFLCAIREVSATIVPRLLAENDLEGSCVAFLPIFTWTRQVVLIEPIHKSPPRDAE